MTTYILSLMNPPQEPELVTSKSVYFYSYFTHHNFYGCCFSQIMIYPKRSLMIQLSYGITRPKVDQGG